jgi:hypothetical protein
MGWATPPTVNFVNKQAAMRPVASIVYIIILHVLVCSEKFIELNVSGFLGTQYHHVPPVEKDSYVI